MTDEETVKTKEPCAHLFYESRSLHTLYFAVRTTEPRRISGWFTNPYDAWEDAAKRLAAPPEAHHEG